MMFPRALLSKVGTLEPYLTDLHGENRFWGMKALSCGPALILSDEHYSYRAHHQHVER